MAIRRLGSLPEPQVFFLYEFYYRVVAGEPHYVTSTHATSLGQPVKVEEELSYQRGWL